MNEQEIQKEIERLLKTYGSGFEHHVNVVHTPGTPTWAAEGHTLNLVLSGDAALTKASIQSWVEIVVTACHDRRDKEREAERTKGMREDLERRKGEVLLGIEVFLPFVCDSIAAQIHARMQQKHKITLAGGDLGMLTLAVVMSAMGRP